MTREDILQMAFNKTVVMSSASSAWGSRLGTANQFGESDVDVVAFGNRRIPNPCHRNQAGTGGGNGIAGGRCLFLENMNAFLKERIQQKP